MKIGQSYTIDEELTLRIKNISKEKRISESWIVNRILGENLEKFKERFK